jgi:glucosamine-6-phosphate deaminase
MEVVITNDANAAAALAADAIERVLATVERPVLGLATGSSPIATYRELIRRHREGRLSFSSAQAFLLDEYVDLPTGHDQSYRRFIERELTDHVDLPAASLHGPDNSLDDPTSGDEYERRLAEAGGVDLQLLGIGGDGHIGFNEPGSSLGSRSRLKTLADSTRNDNARFFGGDPRAVPRHVITQGIATILDARHVVLLAGGASKADIVARAVEGPVTAMVPASALQLHPHTTVIVDEPAASSLTRADYYREVYAHKPGWQQI